jgi:hypothetical protein
LLCPQSSNPNADSPTPNRAPSFIRSRALVRRIPARSLMLLWISRRLVRRGIATMRLRAAGLADISSRDDWTSLGRRRVELLLLLLRDVVALLRRVSLRSLTHGLLLRSSVHALLRWWCEVGCCRGPGCERLGVQTGATVAGGNAAVDDEGDEVEEAVQSVVVSRPFGVFSLTS